MNEKNIFLFVLSEIPMIIKWQKNISQNEAIANMKVSILKYCLHPEQQAIFINGQRSSYIFKIVIH